MFSINGPYHVRLAVIEAQSAVQSIILPWDGISKFHRQNDSRSEGWGMGGNERKN